MNQTIKNAIKIFTDNHGILRTNQAISLGISPRTLYMMRDSGLIRKLNRGLYQLEMSEMLAYPDFVTIALLVPKAVISLTSALHFYGLSSHIPHKVHIALPQSAEKPRLEFPPVDIIWLSQKTYSAGMIVQILDEVSVNFYTKEKTIADCFKFRNKIGGDIALEALKEYVNGSEVNINELMKFARIDRVEKILTQYLEALL